MRTMSLLRSAGLAVVLAMALPAPASPQLGKWVKKAIKQKIADKVEQTVLGTDSSTATSPAAGSLGAAPSGSRVGALPAKKGPGPVFNEYTLEITPEVLAKLEKGLAAEAVDRKAVAQEIAKIPSKEVFDKCHQRVSASPEGQKVYQAYVATLQGTDQQLMAKSEERNRVAKQMDELYTARCGLSGQKADDARDELRRRPEKTGLAASGLTEYQYSILKERIVPFCSLPQPPAPAASGETRIPATEGSQSMFFAYAPGEVATLQGRCPTLMAGINGEQPAQAQQPPVAKKKVTR